MSLAQRAVQGTLLVAGSTYFILTANFLTSLVLMRLLPPEYFGIFALGAFFYTLVGRAKEWGLDAALVHRQDAPEGAAAHHFLLSLGLALVSLALATGVALILPRYYEATVAQVLVVLAVMGLLEGLGATPRTLLEKRLLFRQLAGLNAVAVLLASAFALALALAGAGVWSIVAQRFAYVATASLGAWVFRPWRPRLHFQWSIALWYLRYCFPLWLGGVFAMVLFQFDDWLVGTLVGMAALGFYSRAYQLSLIPTAVVTHVVSKVAMPLYAQLQEDRERLGRAFNVVLSGIVRVAMPLSVFLALEAREVVLLLYGERWLPMVPVFQLLLVYSLLRPIFDDTGALMAATGRPQVISRVLAFQAGCLVMIGPIATVLLGVEGTALAVDGVMLLGVVVLYRFAGGTVKVGYSTAFLVPVLATLGAALPLALLDLANWPLPPLLALSGKASLFGVLYAGSLFLLQGKALWGEARYFWALLRGT